MADYVCDTCGMGVTGMQCAKCGKELVHDTLQLDGRLDVRRRSVRLNQLQNPITAGG